MLVYKCHSHLARTLWGTIFAKTRELECIVKSPAKNLAGASQGEKVKGACHLEIFRYDYRRQYVIDRFIFRYICGEKQFDGTCLSKIEEILPICWL